MLNEGAYWNRTSGTCPRGQNGATTNCDFSNTGLTEEAKEMIEEVTWKLGGAFSIRITVPEFYGYERGTTVYTGRPTEWVGKVGLMYPSDYGYATSGGSTTDRAICLSIDMYDWKDSSDCYNNNWLFNSLTQWPLTSVFSNSYYVFVVNADGRFVSSPVYSSYEIRPSIYLKSNISISGGDGSRNNPYVLKA